MQSLNLTFYRAIQEITSVKALKTRSRTMTTSLPPRLPCYSLILHSLHNSPLRPLIQPIQRCHIPITKLKIVYIGILFYPARRIALRQWYPALLQTIPDQDLRNCLAVFLGEFGGGGVVGFLVADDGGVGLDNDVVFVAVVDYCALLAPRVKLGCMSV